MLFAKWFGGRTNEHEDDEPARFTAPQTAQTAKAPPQVPPENSVRVAGKKPKGFDPYNSGAFERRNAWERTNLR
jgi:hypothetical protein